MKRVSAVVATVLFLLFAHDASAQEPPAPTPVDDPSNPSPATPDGPAPAPPAPAPTPPPPPALAPGPAPLPPVTLGPPPKGARVGPDSMLKRYTSWDANIEGGIGRVVSSPPETVGLLRVRAGVLVIRDPSFYAFGVTYELSHLSAATVGLQAEYLNLETGLWGQIGPLFDVADKAKAGFMASFGVSIIGVEYQGRDYNAYGYASAVFAKLRIPLGMIGFAIRGR